MSVARNLRWGIGYGLLFASFYSLFVLMLYTFRGDEPFRANEISAPVAVVAYFFGGVAGGAIVGLLRPLTKWRIGAMFVGVAAAVPLFLGLGLAMYGPVSNWGENETFGLVATAVILGSLGGYDTWESPI